MKYTFFKYFLIVGALLALCASASAVNRTLIAADDGGIAFDETYTSPSYFYEAKISGDNITTGTLASAVYLVGIDSASSPVIVLQPNHNDWGSKQGGTAAQYYHLTADQHTSATQNATGSLPGILSAADWTLFNSKAEGDHTHTTFDALAVDSLDVGSGDAPTSGIGAAGDIVTSGVLRGASLNMGGTEVITSGRVLQNVTANASIITAGTLGLDRFSAYDDLTTESKIGTGSAQVAAGDHIHAAYAAKADYTSNTLIVAKSGGQYTSIQTAINAASAGMTVLVFPGTYAEKITMVDGVSLVGTDRENCIIQKSEVGAGWGGSHVLTTAGTNEIRNLTIENTYGSYASTALKVAFGGYAKIINCDLIGGAADTVVVGGSSEFSNSRITGGYDTLSITGTGGVFTAKFRDCYVEADTGGTAPLWIGEKTFDAEFYNCTFSGPPDAGALAMRSDTPTGAIRLYVVGCEARDTSGTLVAFTNSDTDHSVVTIYDFYNSYSGRGDAANPTWVDPVWHGDLAVGGDAAVTGDVDITGTATITGNIIADAELYAAWSPTGGLLKIESTGDNTPVINFGYPTETPSVVFDVNLYRGGANELKTDDAFNANSLKIGGTEVITSGQVLQNVTANASIITAGTLSTSRFSAYDDLTTESKIGTGSTQVAAGDHTHTTLDALAVDSLAVGGADAPSSGVGALGDIATSGSLRAAGMSVTSTVWKDWGAATYGHGNIAPYGMLDGNANTADYDGWVPNSAASGTCLFTSVDDYAVYFPIPYMAGTILTQLRVRWQATYDNGGVKVRLVKRDESGTDSAWTVVGAQQTYVDTGTPFPVTVSTYNFADETMSANYSYAIEVVGTAVSNGVNLYSVGIESSKRVY